MTSKSLLVLNMNMYPLICIIYKYISLVRQASCGSVTAQLYFYSINYMAKYYHQIHVAEKHSKSSPNRSQNGAESMTKLPWNDGGGETRFCLGGGGRKPQNPRPRFRRYILSRKIASNMLNMYQQL